MKQNRFCSVSKPKQKGSCSNSSLIKTKTGERSREEGWGNKTQRCVTIVSP